MGCCEARATELDIVNKKKIIVFIDNSKLSSLLCHDIRRLDAQILTQSIDKETYLMFSKGWKIDAPFEMLEINGSIYKFELKVSLILFSKDLINNKKVLFLEFIDDDQRKLMRFLEWRYRLINEKIPYQLARLGFYSFHHAKEWTEKAKLTAATSILSIVERFDIDPKLVDFFSLLSIS